MAARASKYGITIDQAIWQIPLAVLNQLLMFDDIACGLKPRWATSSETTLKNIEDLLADALTSPL